MKTELNVFSRHMGKSFLQLPMLLQTVHTGKRRLRGYVTVSHGNVLARLICRIFKFPPSSNHSRLTVDCYHGPEHMEWIRCFDGHVMRSTFYAHNEFLVERLGLLSLYFKTENYEQYLKEACKLLNELEGSVLEQVLINTVQDEFNVVYLKTSNGVYCLQGEIGGEYLGVRKRADLPEITNDDGYAILKYAPFEQFEGHEIVQTRQIGTAWNGHGFEINFKGLHTKSMLVQSIYCGSAPEELNDCLRLGVGDYQNENK